VIRVRQRAAEELYIPPPPLSDAGQDAKIKELQFNHSELAANIGMLRKAGFRMRDLVVQFAH
jgi:hypothetical protein